MESVNNAISNRVLILESRSHILAQAQSYGHSIIAPHLWLQAIFGLRVEWAWPFRVTHAMGIRTVGETE
jgi:hypothetical protein